MMTTFANDRRCQPWGNCNMALVISAMARARLVRDGEGRVAADPGSRPAPGPLSVLSRPGVRPVECGVRTGGQSCASPPILTTHTETLSLHSPCTSQSIPFLGVNYKLARGSFSRRGRVTFSVTFIVTT